MACKYKYNNNWYSKEELQTFLYKEEGIDKYGKLVKPETKTASTWNVFSETSDEGDTAFKDTMKGFVKSFDNKEEAESYAKSKGDLFWVSKGNNKGIQPTQTNKTLKESIDSVKEKLNENNLEDANMPFASKEKRKEYTSQALINTKIVALKEVAKKYPRSLIRSEVKKISEGYNAYDDATGGFGIDESPFQKVQSLTPEQNKNINDLKSIEPSYAPYSNEQIQAFIDSKIPDSQIEAMIQSGEITFTEDDGKPCAKMGMKSDKFTSGGKWSLLKEFKGALHERGGIDIEIGNSGIKMSAKQGKFEAKFGLVINKKSLK